MADRPDKRPKDVDRNVGEVVEFPSYAATVVRATFQRELIPAENKGYVVATIRIANRTDSAQPYNTADWKLLTPAGSALDPHRGNLGGDNLLSAEPERGRTTEGRITWEVGTQKGDYFVVYDPPGLSHGRGVWKVRV